MKTESHYDFAIVGAGVIGCSVARELARYVGTIAVLDLANDVATGASKANSGIVHGGYDERHGSVKSRLAYRGNSLFKELEQQLHFGFRTTGSLVVAFSEDEEPHLHALLENGTRNGVPGLRIISGQEIRRLEPNINPSVHKALFCPHTGICSPYEYTIALAENAAVNGVDFLLNLEVVSIQKLEDGRFRLQCKPNSIQRYQSLSLITIVCKYLINCAGLYSDKISSMLAQPYFKIIPRIGEYLVLDKMQGELVEHVLFPTPSPVRGKGILVSQTYWGNLLIGPTSRPVDEGLSSQQILHQIISHARHLVPAIDVRRTITSYSGRRAKSSTGDFIIEQHPSVEGFINVAGIDSPGLTCSPAVALLVMELLDKIGNEYMALKPAYMFNPIRPGIIRQPRSSALPLNGDDSDVIVCRCERITKSEIIDSMRRPVPVFPSLTAIKRRTRAGMGKCQGAFCERIVAGLIQEELGAGTNVEGLEPGSSLLAHRRLTREDLELLYEISSQSKKTPKL